MNGNNSKRDARRNCSPFLTLHFAARKDETYLALGGGRYYFWASHLRILHFVASANTGNAFNGAVMQFNLEIPIRRMPSQSSLNSQNADCGDLSLKIQLHTSSHQITVGGILGFISPQSEC